MPPIHPKRKPKIPRYVRIVDDFPMTPTGKIRKVDGRAETVRLLGS
jgi:fatty-acyl-CoA synthase